MRNTINCICGRSLFKENLIKHKMAAVHHQNLENRRKFWKPVHEKIENLSVESCIFCKSPISDFLELSCGDKIHTYCLLNHLYEKGDYCPKCFCMIRLNIEPSYIAKDSVANYIIQVEDDMDKFIRDGKSSDKRMPEIVKKAYKYTRFNSLVSRIFNYGSYNRNSI